MSITQLDAVEIEQNRRKFQTDKRDHSDILGPPYPSLGQLLHCGSMMAFRFSQPLVFYDGPWAPSFLMKKELLSSSDFQIPWDFRKRLEVKSQKWCLYENPSLQGFWCRAAKAKVRTNDIPICKLRQKTLVFTGLSKAKPWTGHLSKRNPPTDITQLPLLLITFVYSK